jgi:hypothetical protein
MPDAKEKLQRVYAFTKRKRPPLFVTELLEEGLGSISTDRQHMQKFFFIWNKDYGQEIRSS